MSSSQHYQYLCVVVGAATVLDIDTHLQSVYTAVYEARSKWRNIGRSLKVSEGTIASIHHSDDGECLHAVLTSWIQTGSAVIQDLLLSVGKTLLSRFVNWKARTGLELVFNIIVVVNIILLLLLLLIMTL